MAKALLIDTSSNKEIIVGVRIKGKDCLLKQKINSQKAQVVLPMIDKILRKHSLRLEDIKSIEVNVKYGSFTGLRVGLSVANALSFALKAPVRKLQFD